MYGFLSSFSILFHCSICLSLCQYHNVNYCSFVVSFEIAKCESSNFAFLFQDCFGYQGPLHFHELQDLFVSFCKTPAGILIDIVLNLQINLDSITILKMLNLPSHEHEIAFHLFGSSLISFTSVLQFLVYKSRTSFFKFILEYLFFLILLEMEIFLNSHFKLLIASVKNYS